MPTYEVETDQGTFDVETDQEVDEATLTGLLAQQQPQGLSAEGAAGEPTPEQLGSLPGGRQVAATATRVGVPLVGAAAGSLLGPVGTAVGGGLGAAGGEALAEKIEGRPLSGKEIALQGAVGAVPLIGRPAATVGREALRVGLQGAALGAAQPVARGVLEGEFPQTSDVLLGAVVGGTLGAGVGAGAGALRPGVVPEVPPENVPRVAVPGVIEPPAPVAPDVVPPPQPPQPPQPALPPPLPIIRQGKASDPAIDTEILPASAVGDTGLPPPRSRPKQVRLDELLPYMQKEFTPEFVERLTKTFEAAPDALEAVTAARGRERIYKTMVNVMRETNVDPAITDLFESTIRSDAQKLNFLSQFAKYVDKVADKNPDLKRMVDKLDRVLMPDNWWQRFLRVYLPIENTRRSLLTGQIVTATRNALSQGIRYSTEILDQAGQGILGGTDYGNAPELVYAVLQRSRRKEGQRLMDELVRLPNDPSISDLKKAKIVAGLMATPLGEGTVGARWWHVWNFFNTQQEMFWRRAMFDATVRGRLRQSGADVGQTLANPRLIPSEIVQEGAERALDVTFASIPKVGTFGRGVIDAYRAMPLLSTVHPFPRFLMNAYKFLFDFSPAGYTRLLLKDGEGKLLAMNPKERAKILTQATLGTAYLGAAMAVRNSDLAGEKWYHIKGGDGRMYDMRPFAPFASYLFMAEVMRTLGEVGTDVIQNGKDLKEAMQVRRGLTSLDVAQGMLSVSRLAGTGLAAVEFLKPQSFESSMNVMRDFAASYLGSFTVPFRAKDFIAGYDPDEAIIRDTRELLAGQALANIPGLSQTLPEAVSPTRTEPLRVETPIRRQLTGLSGRTLNQIERELERLHLSTYELSPKTGDPEADRIITKRMAHVAGTALPMLFRSPRYQQDSDAMKVLKVLNVYKDARALGREALPSYLQARLRAARIPGPTKDVLAERGINLEAAIAGPSQ